jgi:hypothetical protein
MNREVRASESNFLQQSGRLLFSVTPASPLMSRYAPEADKIAGVSVCPLVPGPVISESQGFRPSPCHNDGREHGNAIEAAALGQVPRYFFHLTNGESLVDEVGEELDGAETARWHAMAVARELSSAHRIPDALVGRSISVVDESGVVIFKIALKPRDLDG